VHIADLYDLQYPEITFSLEREKVEIHRVAVLVDHWDPLVVTLPNQPSSANVLGKRVQLSSVSL